MDILKRSIEVVFSPLGLTTILSIAGIILSCTKRRSRTGRRLLISGTLLFLLLLLSPLAEYMVLGLERGYFPMLKPPASANPHTIVVLAGYAEENSAFPITAKLSEQTISSLSEGMRLYRLSPGARMILSGGVVREGEKPVASFMADFLKALGVPAQDITIEGNSTNTYQNLVEVKKIVGSNPFILVVQACDMMRATAVARKLDMKLIPAPAGHWALQHHTHDSASGEFARFFKALAHPSARNLSRIQWAYHEYAGYLWYRLLGRI